MDCDGHRYGRRVIRLSSGALVPAISLGTALNHDRAEIALTVREAVEIGYRGIDTAEAYNNQPGIGDGIRECSVPREQLYISSKVWNTHHGYRETRRAFENTLRELRTDYLDQYLIHWPGQTESFLPTWKALEDLYREGKVRVIGVSNFLVHHLKILMDHAEIMPLVNQLELNPAFVPTETVAFCRTHKIQVEATRPICWGKLDRFPAIRAIAEAHHKTPAQVTLRWHIQHGVRPLPKSVHKERLKENIDVFDFGLTEEEMKRIDALNTGIRETGQDPDTFWMLDTDFEEENKRIMSGLR